MVAPCVREGVKTHVCRNKCRDWDSKKIAMSILDNHHYACAYWGAISPLWLNWSRVISYTVFGQIKKKSIRSKQSSLSSGTSFVSQRWLLPNALTYSCGQTTKSPNLPTTKSLMPNTCLSMTLVWGIVGAKKVRVKKPSSCRIQTPDLLDYLNRGDR